MYGRSALVGWHGNGCSVTWLSRARLSMLLTFAGVPKCWCSLALSMPSPACPICHFASNSAMVPRAPRPKSGGGGAVSGAWRGVGPVSRSSFFFSRHGGPDKGGDGEDLDRLGEGLVRNELLACRRLRHRNQKKPSQLGTKEQDRPASLERRRAREELSACLHTGGL